KAGVALDSGEASQGNLIAERPHGCAWPRRRRSGGQGGGRCLGRRCLVEAETRGRHPPGGPPSPALGAKPSLLVANTRNTRNPHNGLGATTGGKRPGSFWFFGQRAR